MIISYWYVDTLILLVTFVYLIYKYTSRNYDYWAKRNVPFIPPKPFVGNFWDIIRFKLSIGPYLEKLYNTTSGKFIGIFVFSKPCLVIRSPDLVKSILIRDFNYFTNRTVASCKHDLLTDSMLFLSKSSEWKGTRKLISPIFTSGKLKSMFPMINDIGDELNKYLAKHLNEDVMESKEICAKYSTDVIAKCAFAINAHSFDGQGDFRKHGGEIFNFTLRNSISQTSFFFLPSLVNLFKLTFMPQHVNNFLTNVFETTLKAREEAGLKGNDLIDLIIDIKKNKDFVKEYKFEGPRVVGQAAQFFVAGFETTSSTMAFTLYELCIHPNIQQKLREEIQSSIRKHHGITYESLLEMKYLHMCVSETLRMYPVLPFLDRMCNENYKVPGTDVVIEKGTPIYIPMFGLHYDPEIFPNPKIYNPERFAENTMNTDGLSYIPFGDGPRNCIGERFGMLSTKLGLAKIISEFEVVKTKETPVPLVFEPKSFVLASKVGLPMKFKKCVSHAA